MTGVGGTYNGLPEFGPFEWPLSLTNKSARKYKVTTHGDACCEIRSTRKNSGGKTGKPPVIYLGSKSFSDLGTILSSTYIDRGLHQQFITYMSDALGMALPTNTRIPNSLFIHGGTAHILSGPHLGNACPHLMGSVDGFDWFDLPTPYSLISPTPETAGIGGFGQVSSVSFNPVSGITSLVLFVDLLDGHGPSTRSYISLDAKGWQPGVDTVKLPINRITGFDPGGRTVEVRRTPEGVATSIDGGQFSITDRRVNLFTSGIITIDDNGQDAFISGGSGGTTHALSSITASITGTHWDPYYNDDGSTHPSFEILTSVAGVPG